MTGHRLRSIRLAIASFIVLAGCSGGGSSESSSESVALNPVATELRPVPHGFSFANFPSSASPEEFGAMDLVAMFGPEVCVNGVAEPCSPTAEAAAWARMVNQTRASGHCEGLVVNAARRFVDGATPPSVELTTDAATVHSIFQSFATQFLPEVQDERDRWAEASLRDIVGELVKGLSTGATTYSLGLYGERGGHAVLPYAVEFPDPDTAVVRVYDSNWPGKDRFVTIDLAENSWSFSFAAPDPSTDPSPWTGGRGDIDLASLAARTNSKCPFCGDADSVTNSFLVIRAEDDSWSVSNDFGTYSPSQKNDVEGIDVAPVRGATGILDYVVRLSQRKVQLALASSASAFVVQPNSITQILATDTKGARVDVSQSAIITDDRSVTLTVASDNLVASVSGAQSSVQISGDQLLATVEAASGNEVKIVVNEQVPQAVIQSSVTAISSTATEFVVTTKTDSGLVESKEVAVNGSTTTRTTSEDLNLNSVVAELPKPLVTEGPKLGLPAVEVRSLANPEYVADKIVLAQDVSVATRPVTTTAAPTSTVPQTTMLAPLLTTTTTVRTTVPPTTTTSTTTTSTTTTTTTTTSSTTTTTTTTSTTLPPPPPPPDPTTTTSTSTTTTSTTTSTTSTTTSTTSTSTTSTSTTTTTVPLLSRTLTIEPTSYVSTYNKSASPPTLASNPSAGSGTRSYSSSTTSVCTINASTAIVTLITAGTCRLSASIASDGTYDAATSAAISFTVTFAIGDTGPGGGKIFITPSTSGNTTGKYFEAALGTWNGGTDSNNNWCHNTNYAIGSGAQGSAIGTGKANTDAITAYCTSGAAFVAKAYTGAGLSDWFLPSVDELAELYTNRASVGGFNSMNQCCPSSGIVSTTSYWSSTEVNSSQAKPLSFLDAGGGDNWGKIYGFNVRPVRMFLPID